MSLSAGFEAAKSEALPDATYWSVPQGRVGIAQGACGIAQHTARLPYASARNKGRGFLPREACTDFVRKPCTNVDLRVIEQLLRDLGHRVKLIHRDSRLADVWCRRIRPRLRLCNPIRDGLVTVPDLLRSAGFQVIEAAHADEALNVLKASATVDVLLTDISMPLGSMDGIRLAGLVRKTWPTVKIIVASAYWPTRVDVLDAFMVKPVDSDRLVERIKQLLG